MTLKKVSIALAILLTLSGCQATQRQNATTGESDGVGYYFDQQEKALREALLNSGVQVERVGENQLLLRLENGIGFSSSSYALDSSIHNTLKGVAQILVEYPDTSLVIDGFTDSTGNDASNQILSERRAESVRKVITQSWQFWLSC